MVMKSFQRKEELKAKEILASNYNCSYMISNFVGCVLNGKPIPSIHQLFPSQFPTEEKQDNSWMLYKEQMLDFAMAHNKKRKVNNE